MMKALDLYCGAGGATLGLLRAGMELAGCYDFDLDACATHLRNFSYCPLTRADLRVVDPDDLPDADFWWASPPCQPFSVAGKRLARADPRDMFPWTLRAIAARRPAWVVIENPPGLLSAEGGRYIAGVVRSLERSGYTVEHRVLDAACYGVPQRRHRVILVGSRERRRIWWPEHTHGDPRSLAPLGDDRRPWVTVRQALGIAVDTPSAVVTTSEGRGLGQLGRQAGAGRHIARTIAMGEAPSQTIDSSGEWHRPGGHSAGEPSRGPDSATYLRRLTVREAALLQSFPNWFRFSGSQSSIYRQIGNAVPPPLAMVVGRAILEASS